MQCVSLAKTPDPRVISVKILYWGPGEVGKTTNFECLKHIFAANRVSKGITIETTDNRTLWCDSVMFKFPFTSLHCVAYVNVSTTTGQERFLTTREYILENSDGAIFVADSDPSKIAANQRSFEELKAFSSDSAIPIYILLNKRDLPHAISIPDFIQQMNLPVFSPSESLKIPYESTAHNFAKPGDVARVFTDLIIAILSRKLTSR